MAPFSRKFDQSLFRYFSCMVATLKKDIQKIKKMSLDIIKKMLMPKYDPNRSSSFRDIRYDRQTDIPTPKNHFF